MIEKASFFLFALSLHLFGCWFFFNSIDMDFFLLCCSSSDTERGIQAKHLLCKCLSIVINVNRDICSSNGSSSVPHLIPFFLPLLWQYDSLTLATDCYFQNVHRFCCCRCCCCCWKSFCLFRDEAPVKTPTNADSYFVQNLLISEYMYTQKISVQVASVHEDIYTMRIQMHSSRKTVELKQQIIVFERCVVIFSRKEKEEEEED